MCENGVGWGARGGLLFTYAAFYGAAVGFSFEIPPSQIIFAICIVLSDEIPRRTNVELLSTEMAVSRDIALAVDCPSRLSLRSSNCHPRQSEPLVHVEPQRPGPRVVAHIAATLRNCCYLRFELITSEG